jgi:hypothetical protein
MALRDTLLSTKFSTTFSFLLFFVGQVALLFVDDLYPFELLLSIFPLLDGQVGIVVLSSQLT